MVKSTLAAPVMFAFPQLISDGEVFLSVYLLLLCVDFYDKYMNNYVCL